MDYVVLKQIPSGPCADSWDTTYVDVTADSVEEAVDIVAKDEHRGGQGRYVAIPNEWWVGWDVTVKRIAEVDKAQIDMV